VSGRGAIRASIALAAIGAGSARGDYCPKSAMPPTGSGMIDLPELLASRCQPGDIVLLDPQQTGLIGRACGFAQQIIPVQTEQLGPRIMCVMVAPRAVR
jgi:hypothetical protein